MPLSYCGLPHRSDSSAPHSARLMMLGGWPGISTPDGGVHCRRPGASGGEIRIAEMFCPKGCSLVAGLYPRSCSSGLSGSALGGGPAGASVTGASTGRVTAICTVVVVPTNTGSVLRGPSTGLGVIAPLAPVSGAEVSYSVWYQGPHEPSACFARTRVEVPARSPVTATNENDVLWVSSRTVTPPPSPINGCSASWVPLAGEGAGALSRVGSTIQDTMTTVAAIAVINIVGARVRDCTRRCYVCFYCYL